MGKNNLIIQSIVQGRLTPAQAAEHFGVSRRWVYELMRRHRAQGDEGLEPRSRRPLSSPQTTTGAVQERILALRRELTARGLDSGAQTIAWHLRREGLAVPAASTIHRILRAESLVADQPRALLGTASRPSNPTRPGNPTSPTGRWPTAATWRS